MYKGRDRGSNHGDLEVKRSVEIGLVLWLATPAQGIAWGETGHRIVCEIAFQQLSRQTLPHPTRRTPTRLVISLLCQPQLDNALEGDHERRPKDRIESVLERVS